MTIINQYHIYTNFTKLIPAFTDFISQEVVMEDSKQKRKEEALAAAMKAIEKMKNKPTVKKPSIRDRLRAIITSLFKKIDS